MNRLPPFIFAVVLFLVFGFKASSSLANPFNILLEEQRRLEKSFGVKTLECFPFIEKIGFTEDQKALISNCLTGVRTLGEALAEVSGADYTGVGISSRFLRTGGFQTVLVPWDASKQDMAKFLNDRLSESEQEAFLEKVFSLKRTILSELRINSLYCTLRLSNENCLRGYTTLASLKAGDLSGPVQWREVVLTDSSVPRKDPYALTLKYDSSAGEMISLLSRDPVTAWDDRRKMYETLQSRFGDTLKKQLKIGNYHCARDLTEQECMQGMTHLAEAGRNRKMTRKFWGHVRITRHNTLIKGDYDVDIRFDLSPEEIVRYFDAKHSHREVTENNVLAEKLEKRTKNNSTGLRAVCDLESLSSTLCVRGFKTFITFVKNHRDYRVAMPWTDLMFVDGSQLARVNFALTSKSRHTYIYIDAGSTPQEFTRRLMTFRAAPHQPSGSSSR